jgi:Flp pilus assembly protein TadB
MDVKTESKLLLSAFILLPAGAAGVLMLINDAWGLLPYFLFLVGVLGLLYLWWPRKKSGKGDKHKHN